MTRGLVAASLVVALALASPAMADDAGRPDPREVGGKMDIVTIAHRHGRERPRGAWLQHRVAFDEAFTGRWFRRRGDLGIRFFGTGKSATVVRNGGWKGRLYNRRGRLVGRPTVWRPNRRTVVVSLPVRWLGTDVERYRWRAVSATAPRRCDDAPDAAAACPAYLDETRQLLHPL